MQPALSLSRREVLVAAEVAATKRRKCRKQRKTKYEFILSQRVFVGLSFYSQAAEEISDNKEPHKPLFSGRAAAEQVIGPAQCILEKKIFPCPGTLPTRQREEDIRNDFEKAIETFQEALLFSWEDGDRRHLAATLNCLGVLYFHLPKAKPKRSLEFLTRALPLQRKITGELVAIANTFNNLGKVYYMEKHYKETLSVYLEVLNIRRTSLGAENLDVAATVYNTGQTFQQLKEMDTGIYYYNDFVRIAVPKLG